MDNLNIKHILSEEFQNLTEFALKEKKNYLTAKPVSYTHLTLPTILLV